MVVVVAGGGGSVRRARARTACKSVRCWEVMEVVEEYEVEAGNVIILVVVEVASSFADVMVIGKGTGVPAGVAGVVGRVKVRATQARFSLKECPRDHPPSRPQVMALGLESPMRNPYAESASPGTKRKGALPLNRSWWIPFLHSWMK